MNAFEREETLINHKRKCGNHEYCKIVMPRNNCLKFTNVGFKNRVPFVIYAAFESINHMLDNQTLDSQNTKKLKEQKASVVGTYIHFDYPNLLESNYVYYRGPDVVEVFCNWLIDLEKKFSALLKTEIGMCLTPEEQEEFCDATKCYYCDGKLLDDRVRDHNHYNGKYRGVAHNACNLNVKHANFVPIFFHNLSNYDAHLFIKTLSKKLGKIQLKLLAKTEEYISFQFGCFRFLQSGLDNVTNEDFKITQAFYPNDGDFKLLRKKGRSLIHLTHLLKVIMKQV